jgi:hypothetical protein
LANNSRLLMRPGCHSPNSDQPLYEAHARPWANGFRQVESVIAAISWLA